MSRREFWIKNRYISVDIAENEGVYYATSPDVPEFILSGQNMRLLIAGILQQLNELVDPDGNV